MTVETESTMSKVANGLKKCVGKDSDPEEGKDNLVKSPAPRRDVQSGPIVMQCPTPAVIFGMSVKTWVWFILVGQFIASIYKYAKWGMDRDVVTVFEVLGMDAAYHYVKIPLAILNFLFLISLLIGRTIAIKHFLAPHMCWQLTIACGYILMTAIYGFQELFMTQTAYHYPGCNFIDLYFGQYSDIMWYISNSGDVRVGFYFLYPMLLQTMCQCFQGYIMYLIYNYYSIIWFIENDPYVVTDRFPQSKIVHVEC